MPRESSYSKAFRQTIDELELRALKAGTTLTALCRDVHVSRSTPDRWRRQIPTTIKIVGRLQERLAVVEKETKRTNAAVSA